MATTDRDVFRSKAFAVGVAQSVAWTALGVVALMVIPKFDGIFKDFGVKLTYMTVAVLDLGYFLKHYWYLALVLVILWPFVNYGVVALLSPRPDVVLPKRLWYFATWVVILLVIMFALIALFVPLIGDIQGLSASPVPPGTPTQ